MDHHWAELGMVGHGEVVRVEYAAATILVGIHQHDDVLIRSASQHVVQRLQPECGQIARAVECVEVGAQHRVLPFACCRRRCAALCRDGLHCHHVEPVAHALEGLVGKDGIHRGAGVGYERLHLALGVALCHEGYVDAACGVAGLP